MEYHLPVSDIGSVSSASPGQSIVSDPSMAYSSDVMYSTDSEPSFSNEEFVELKNLMADGGDRFSVTAVAFDGQEELIWMGNQGVGAVLDFLISLTV